MIKAIETRYQGYRFRSRLEARWAVFFDALGVKWEYEREGYDLGDVGYYLPDFWLPEAGWHAEVKPLGFADESPQAAQKLNCFDDDPPDESWGLILLVGLPELVTQSAIKKSAFWKGSTTYVSVRCGVYSAERINTAVRAARAARFEHGETPRVR